MIAPVQHVQESIRDFCIRRSIQPPSEGIYVHIDPVRAQHIAAEYEAQPQADPRQEVREAYSQLTLELIDQWHHALLDGYVFEPWDKPGQPYANSREMQEDVRYNKHLFFFRGGEPHPYLNESTITGYSANEVLRAVHDLYGHAAEGYGFGMRGETNAWLKHSQMFSPPAQRALTTETFGQNCYFNFGPFRGVPVAERPFPPQKAILLSPYACDWQVLLSPMTPRSR